MYISGTISTFPSRQHQLISGTNTYNSFMSEFGSYSGLMPAQWRAQRQREFDIMKTRYGISGVSPNYYPLSWTGGDSIQSMTANVAVFTDDNDTVDGRVWTAVVPSGQKIKASIVAQIPSGAMGWEVYFYPISIGVPLNIVPYGFTDDWGECTVDITAPFSGYLAVNCQSITIGNMITVTASLSNLT